MNGVSCVLLPRLLRSIQRRSAADYFSLRHASFVQCPRRRFPPARGAALHLPARFLFVHLADFVPASGSRQALESPRKQRHVAVDAPSVMWLIRSAVYRRRPALASADGSRRWRRQQRQRPGAGHASMASSSTAASASRRIVIALSYPRGNRRIATRRLPSGAAHVTSSTRVCNCRPNNGRARAASQRAAPAVFPRRAVEIKRRPSVPVRAPRRCRRQRNRRHWRYLKRIGPIRVVSKYRDHPRERRTGRIADTWLLLTAAVTPGRGQQVGHRDAQCLREAP